MASIGEAYNTIMRKHLTKQTVSYPIVGVLKGRVENATYNIYTKNGKFFCEVNDKMIPLTINNNDHGKDIEVPLTGLKYKIDFFNK